MSLNDLVQDYTEFQTTIFECTEILLKDLFMNEAIQFYGIPWWQWIVGGAFLATLGYIILSKVTR